MSINNLKAAEALVHDLITTNKYHDMEFDSAQTVNGLTKIPVISKYDFDSGLGYKLVGQAQEEGAIKVEETQNVSELNIYNQADYPVLIPRGSLMISDKTGWQDRALVTDIMIDANDKLNIPVVCIERNRWGQRSSRETSRIFDSLNIGTPRRDSHFRVGRFVSPRVDKGLVGSVSMRFGGEHYFNEPESSLFRADQSDIWHRVDMEINEADVDTPTKALTDVIIKKEKEGKSEFDIYEGEIGDIFIGSDEILGMELYETPEIWKTICEQTIQRYKISNSEKGGKLGKSLIDKFLSDLSKCGVKAAKSIGIGYDVRLIDREIDGACLVSDSSNYSPIHLTAIPKYEETRKKPYSTRPGRRVITGNPIEILDSLIRYDPSDTPNEIRFR